MMKLFFLTLVVIVSMMQLVKSQCDEGMIKRMAVEVCGLKKRSIDTIDNNLDSDFEIERQYRQLTGDDDAPDYLQNFNEKNIEDNYDSITWFRRKRNKGKDIEDLVKECCYRKCTADDFRGMCGY